MNENYEKYLQSEEWRQLRKYVIERDDKKCWICGGAENLCVHHLWYPEEDTPDNLVTLCKRCHSDLHCFYNEIHESLSNGELKEEREKVVKALDDFRESVYKIQDKYVFQRSKELSNSGDISFFTGNNKSHVKRKFCFGDFELGESKLNRYTRLLFELQPYRWALLNPKVRLSNAFYHDSELRSDEKAENYSGRGLNTYQKMRIELFGTSKSKKRFSISDLIECVRKHGKNSVYASYLDFLKSGR
ncbi:MAG: HNH endonuclease [Methanobrevibacter sp.]|nr:HNH endonuclease [Methanobrevibacter sp.]